jgi:hypothetical protein
VLAAVFLLAGCGSDGPTTVPVGGQITFDGEPPPADGAVYFAPIKVAAGFPRRPGRARFGQDGSYEATSFADGDGLVPGEYRVSVECWKSPPGTGPGGGAGVSYVAPGFDPPNLVVTEENGSIEYDLDVTLRP